MNHLVICGNLPKIKHDDGTFSVYCYVAVHSSALHAIDALAVKGGGILDLQVSKEGFLSVYANEGRKNE